MSHMSQAEIDALLKDSMFEDSEIRQSKQPEPSHKEQESGHYGSEAFDSYEESHKKEEKKIQESMSYGNEEFESYEESRRTFSKKENKPIRNQKRQPSQKRLADIKEEVTPQAKPKGSSQEKVKAKTGIQFYPPKQTQSSSQQKKNLPYNYARLQEREKQLLLTTVTEENKNLKQEIKIKDAQYKKLENAYKVILNEKAQSAASVREITLEKQLTALQSKFEKMQQLYKMERERNKFKSTSRTQQTFIPQDQVSQRQQEHLDLIEQLKERLISSNNELKTLQTKMNQGENYIDELKRKMKRVEQLEFKMEKMGEQAENDREYIRQLRQKNGQLEHELFETQKQKRLQDIEIQRYRTGQETQKDTLEELKEIKKEKEMLERTLRDFAGNMKNYSKKTQMYGQIEDSGELLKP